MIRTLLTALLLAAPAPAPALAAPPQAQSRTFDATDLFGIEVATDPQISPDGRWVAYVRRSNDIMVDRGVNAIWLIGSSPG